MRMLRKMGLMVTALLLAAVLLSLGNVTQGQAEESPKKVTELPPGMSLNRFLHSAARLSTPLYMMLLADLGLIAPADDPDQPAVITSPIYTNQVTLDERLDAETTMTALRGIGLDNLDYTDIGYMKHSLATTRFRNQVAATAAGDGYWTYTELPLIDGNHDASADPVLASNPFTTGYGKRIYYAALHRGPNRQSIVVHCSTSGGKTWLPLTTSNVVASYSGSSSYLDKPDIDVSYHYYDFGNVYVTYMQLDLVNYYNNKIYVARSTNGGSTWSLPVLVTQSQSFDRRIHSPQISCGSGRVYCSWVDYDLDKLRMSYSDDYGSTWSAPQDAAFGPMLIDENRKIKDLPDCRTLQQMRYDTVDNQLIFTWHESAYYVSGTHNGAAVANTLIDTTKNFVTAGVQVGDYVRNRNKTYDTYWDVSAVSSTTLTLTNGRRWQNGINPLPAGDPNLVFHPGDSYIVKAKTTDICFVRKTINGWQPKVKLNLASTAKDQFQPSLDFSDTPNEILIGFYDRSADPANSQYEARWVKVDASGNNMAEGLVWGSFQSTTDVPSRRCPPICPADNPFIGDYTDTFYWPYQDGSGARWHFVYTARHPSHANFEIWAAAVN